MESSTYPTGARIASPGGGKGLDGSPVDRRSFLRATGGSFLAASAALLGACEQENPHSGPDAAARSIFFSDDFGGEGWQESWRNVRYAGAVYPAQGAMVVELPPPTPKAIGRKGKVVAAYMARPVLAVTGEVSHAEIEATVEAGANVEAGLIARARFDEAYALLVHRGSALLCRYTSVDRIVLAEDRVEPGDAYRLTLIVQGTTLSGLVEPAGGSRAASLRAHDETPLQAGAVGVLVNPIAVGPGRAAFRRFRAVSSERPVPSRPRIVYAFTGAVVPDGEGYKARVTALADPPGRVRFDGPGGPVVRPARSSLGAAHAWLRGLQPGTGYSWRAAPEDGDPGPEVRFRTPPAPGGPVRFVFASCTSGRVTEYPSFATAAARSPDFYLHAGDWGYADLTASHHSPDQFQARWVRMLRAPEIAGMLRSTPLMLWQDDHDYAADNGWARTVKPMAVDAFDQLHANPSDDFFDVRWGDVHVWCLDCRLHATDPDAPDGPGKSRLGRAQKRWLMEGMERSDAPVKVVASSMVFRNKPDEDKGWHNAYAAERDELLAHFAAVRGTVVILSGDSHGQRLIHHHEFGDLYEFNSSGTDFPGGGQGNNDPGHTLVNVDDRSGFALVTLDPAGTRRKLRVACIASDDGSELFSRDFEVG